MKKYYVFIMTIFLFSCTKEATPPEQPKYFTSCEEMTDVTGLNLYPFELIAEDEYLFDIWLQKRQIPEDFLRGMTTKELLYQISRLPACIFGNILIFASESQRNFVSYTSRLNMCVEFINRPDTPQVLLQLLQKIDPSFIRSEDGNNNIQSEEPFVNCYYFYHCVQIFAAQPEIITHMTGNEINRYIDEQIRLHDAIRDMEPIDKGLTYPYGIRMGMYGLCNIMMHYEFEPFIQLMEEDYYIKLMMDGWGVKAFDPSLIIKCIEKFRNREK